MKVKGVRISPELRGQNAPKQQPRQPGNANGKSNIVIPPQMNFQDIEFGFLSDEFVAWSKWLDRLYDETLAGDQEKALELVTAKFAFLDRRVTILKERCMHGLGRNQEWLSDASDFSKELEQILFEITGQYATVMDDWPLPFRLQTSNANTNLEASLEWIPLNTETSEVAMRILGSLRLILQIVLQQSAFGAGDTWQDTQNRLDALHALCEL